jgi:hypothetical protein
MATDMKARQLIKQVPALGATDMNSDAQTATLIGEGWEVVTDYVMHFVWRGYIDMGGYTKDELTFFTQAVDIQNASLIGGGPGVTGAVINDLITTRRISNAEVYYDNNGFLTSLPGNSIPALDIQEVVYGETAFHTPYSATNGSWRKLTGSSLGLGNPTAADRLHITRIVYPAFSGTVETMTLPSCNFVIGGVTGHEKDLVYIERLRRAYTQDPGRNV